MDSQLRQVLLVIISGYGDIWFVNQVVLIKQLVIIEIIIIMKIGF